MPCTEAQLWATFNVGTGQAKGTLMGEAGALQTKPEAVFL